MHYDFVDIGTSDFNIGKGDFDWGKKYLAVEPVAHYLYNIPDLHNLTKANYAITNKTGFVDVFYLERGTIESYDLPSWARGCNKIGCVHPTIQEILNIYELPKELLKVQKANCITFSQLLDLYNITSIGHLKIDTEGHDHIILEMVAQDLLDGKVQIDSIMLEYLPFFGNTQQIDSIAETLKAIYPDQTKLGEDLYLNKQKFSTFQDRQI
jgi:hypothetical protein